MREGDQIEAAVTRAERAGQGHHPDPQNPRLLRDALGRFTTGVTVVTTCEAGGGAPVGMTVNSFASVSLDPALILWSAARSSLRHAHFSAAPAFAVHVLRHDQIALCQRFARAGAGFDGLEVHLNAEGVPVLDDTLARFECVTEATHEGGDHTIIIGRVARFDFAETGAALCFSQGRYGRFIPET